jgi:hypothetical protein
MSLGLFCYPEDKFGLQLAARMNAAIPASCQIFDLSWQKDPALVLSNETLTCCGRDLNGLDWLWVRGLPYMDPVLPPALRTVDWSLWRYEHLLEQQRYSAWESLFMELERRGVKLINSRRLCGQQFMTAGKLLHLQRLGFRVPELMCSNDMAAVLAFTGRHPSVWWRPATGRAAWQRFTDKQRLFLITPDKPPVVLAAYAGHRQMRAWVWGGESLLCMNVEPATMRAVEELGTPTDHGELARLESLEMWSPFTLGEEEISEFKRLADVEAALLFEVIFDVAADGKVTFFGVDYDPPLESLPPSVQAYLIEALSRRLSGSTTADMTAQHLLPARVERPVLFLRRMLQFQFEMEQSKYQDAES